MSTVTELEFASRVSQPMFEAACQMSQLESLTIKWSGIKTLDPLTSLTSLKSLRIGMSGSIKTVEPIAAISHLRDLELEEFNGVDDFSPLASKTQLERLTIDGGFNTPQRIISLHFASGLSRLQYLSIRNARIAEDGFDPILNLPELTSFHSAWYFPYSEFAKLKKMPKLVNGNVARMEQYLDYMAAEPATR